MLKPLLPISRHCITWVSGSGVSGSTYAIDDSFIELPSSWWFSWSANCRFITGVVMNGTESAIGFIDWYEYSGLALRASRLSSCLTRYNQSFLDSRSRSRFKLSWSSLVVCASPWWLRQRTTKLSSTWLRESLYSSIWWTIIPRLVSRRHTQQVQRLSSRTLFSVSGGRGGRFSRVKLCKLITLEYLKNEFFLSITLKIERVYI